MLDELLDICDNPDCRDLITTFIWALPLDPLDKKLLYMEWANATRTEITGYDIARATGQPPGTL